MKVINNRYIIKEELEPIGGILLRYRVEDMYYNYQRQEMILFEKNLMPKELYNFISKNFLKLKTVTKDFFYDIYSFSIVSIVDGIKKDTNAILFTYSPCDYDLPLVEWLKKGDSNRMIFTFHSILKALNSTNLKGLYFDCFDLDNLKVTYEDGNAKIIHNNIILSKVLKLMKNMDNYEEIMEFFNFDGKKQAIDLKKLVSMLISILELRKESSYDNLEERLNSLFEKASLSTNEKENNQKLSILNFLKSVYNGDYSNKIPDLYFMFRDFSKVFSLPCEIEKNPNLCINQTIIGRDREISEVANGVLANNIRTNAFFILGDLGVGKTMFLKEISHTLSMDGVIVVNSYNENLDQNSLWNDFIKSYSKIIDELMYNERRKENISKMKMLKTMFQNYKDIFEQGSRHKLGFRIAKLMSDLLLDRKICFIIDNFEYTAPDMLELILLMLDDKVLREQITGIFAVDAPALSESSDLSKFYNALSAQGKVANIYFNNLSKGDTVSLVNSTINYIGNVADLYDFIYSESSGNPLLIVSKVEELIQENSLSLNKYTGHWEFDIDNVANKAASEIDKLKALEELDIAILKVLSSAEGTMNTRIIAKILEEKNENIMVRAENLKVRGMIVLYYDGISANLSFYSRDLKKDIYESLGPEESTKYHQRILDHLDGENQEDQIEILYQLNSIGEFHRAREKALEIADQKSSKNFELALGFYKAALNFTGLDDYKKRMEIAFKISDLHLTLGFINEAREALDSAMEDYSNLSDWSLKEIYIYRHARLSFALRDRKSFFSMYRRLGKIPKKHRTKMYDAIEKKLKADGSALRQNFKKAIRLYEDLIKRYEGDREYDYILSDTYRFSSNLQEESTNINKIIRYQSLAAEASDRLGDIRAKLVSLNNIAVIILNKTLDYNKAIKIFKNLSIMTRDYSIIDLEINSYISLANAYHRMCNYKKALEKIDTALIRAELAGIKEEQGNLKVLVLREYLAMGNFISFRNYFLDNQRDIETSKDSRNKAYDLLGEYFFRLGDISRSVKYQKIVLKSKKSTPRRLRTKDLVNEIDERSHILEISKMLLLGQFKAKKVVEYIEYLDKSKRRLGNYRAYLGLQRILYAISTRFGTGAIESIMVDLSKIDRLSVTNISKMYFYYFYAILAKTDSDKLELFSYAGEQAKEFPYDEMNVKILIETGKILVNYGYDGTILNNMLEALTNAIHIIENIPKKNVYSFYNNNDFAYIFEYFEDFIYNENTRPYREGALHPPRTIRNNFDNIIYEINHSEREPAKLVLKNLLSQRGISDDIREVVKKFTSDRMENIKLLLEYFSIKTLADQAYILMGKGEGSFDILASYIAGSSKVDLNMIHDYIDKDRVSIKKRSDNEDGIKGFESFISFPLQLRGGRRGYRDTSFLVLMTNNVINKFDELINNYQYLDTILLLNLIDGHELKKTISVDKLTGALTRKQLENELKEIVKYIGLGYKSSIALFDLDKFKMINDNYGHQAGDLVLKNTVKIAMQVFPKECKIGRYGGEEFVVIMPDIDERQAFEYTEAFRRDVKASTYEEYGNIKVTVSAGITTGKAFEKLDVDTLIEKADRALYRAKETGRDKVLFYSKDFEEKSVVQTRTYGVVTGNDIEDERMFMIIANLLLYKRDNIDTSKIITEILKRSIELLGTEEAGLITKTYQICIMKGCPEAIGAGQTEELEKRLKNKESVIYDDFLDDTNKDQITGMPIWNSVLGLKVKNFGKSIGILYFKAPRDEKSFELRDLNVAYIISNIINLNLSLEEK